MEKVAERPCSCDVLAYLKDGRIKRLESEVARLKGLVGFMSGSDARGAVPLPLAPVASALRMAPKGFDVLFPCVYFLMAGDAVVYVVQTKQLPVRLCDHRKYGKVFDRVFFLPVDASEMEMIEFAFIERLKPSLNGKGFGKKFKTDGVLERLGFPPLESRAEIGAANG